MNIPCKKSPQSGGVLIVTLLTFVVVCVTLAGIINWTNVQNRLVARSQSWNGCIPVAEAGIERAMLHLYHNPTISTNVTFTNMLVEGSYNTTLVPGQISTIYSTGYVQAPFSAAPLARIVQVTVTNTGIFSMAIATKGTITMSGNVSIDSFDSSDPNFSNNGQYSASKDKANGNIGSNASVSHDVTTSGSVSVKGKVETGIGSSASSFTSNGSVSVGDTNWVGHSTGIESGYFLTNYMNFQFQDPTVPQPSLGSVPGSGTVDGTNYSFVVNQTNMHLSSVSLSGSQKIIVTTNTTLEIDGDVKLSGATYIYIQPGNAVTLIVNGDIDMSGQSYINVTTNASLTLYGNGQKTNLSGQGLINNGGYATNFVYYGSTNNTSVSLSGGSAFVGLVDAPEAAVSVSGGSRIIGSVIANTFTGTGGFSLSYDEASKNFGLGNWAIASWTQL